MHLRHLLAKSTCKLTFLNENVFLQNVHFVVNPV